MVEKTDRQYAETNINECATMIAIILPCNVGVSMLEQYS